MTAEKDVQVARKGGRGRGNLGNARKKTFFGGGRSTLKPIDSLVNSYFMFPDRFYTLLADYGKDSVDKLDQREKQLIEMQKRQQAELMR